MNLAELIIWSFSVVLAMGLAVAGYNCFGPIGAVSGVVAGILVGIITGGSISKLFYRSRRRKKPNANK